MELLLEDLDAHPEEFVCEHGEAAVQVLTGLRHAREAVLARGAGRV